MEVGRRMSDPVGVGAGPLLPVSLPSGPKQPVNALKVIWIASFTSVVYPKATATAVSTV